MQATRETGGTENGTLLENELVRSGLSKNFYTWVMDMDFVCAGLGGAERYGLLRCIGERTGYRRRFLGGDLRF